MAVAEVGHSDRRNALGIAATFSLVFFVIFVWLRSTNIFSVDGAHRSFRIYRENKLWFDGTNHLLFPVNVLAWTRLVSAVGGKANDAMTFFGHAQLMNCAAGAGCLLLLYLLTYPIVRSHRVCAVTIAAYGLSTAFLEQATNISEPMAGVFWSLLGISLAALSFRVKSDWVFFASGGLFALAMATYQSAVLAAPVAVVLICRSRGFDPNRRFRAGTVGKSFIALACGGIVGVAAIYGWAYRQQGINKPAAMAKQFFVVTGSRAYSGLTGGKLLNVPVGLVRDIFPVAQDYTGIRSLVTGPRSTLLAVILLLILITAFLALGVAVLWRGRSTVSAAERIGIAGCATGLACTIAPVLWWNPNYDKLWLQPLACVAVFSAIAIAHVRLTTKAVRSAMVIIASVIAIGIIFNVGPALKNHREGTWGTSQAEEVAAEVRPEDIVIGGWDNISMLYAELYARDGQFVDFSTEAVYYGAKAPGLLQSEVLRAESRGGEVFFLGLIDVPPGAWESFLGRECGVPFSALDVYRRRSSMLMRWSNGAESVSFERLDASTDKQDADE